MTITVIIFLGLHVFRGGYTPEALPGTRPGGQEVGAWLVWRI